MNKIRLLNDNDSIEELTNLINRAYKYLDELGLKYWGANQKVIDTQKRIINSECYVKINPKNNKIIATIVFNNPKSRIYHSWYEQKFVTTFGQFAVDPNFQKQGIGNEIMDFIEQRAVELGFDEISCDTAATATHLIKMYTKRGYRIVDKADWNHTNYLSVILSKKLNL